MGGQLRILVTGATGFIGRHTLGALERQGFDVHAVARCPGGRQADGASWHVADLMDPASGRELCERIGPTHLLHLAWYAEHGEFWNAVENLDWLAATVSLLRSFTAAGGRRFVGAGSCAEYAWTRDLYDELETPLRPASLYGAAKASAFLAGSAYAATAKPPGLEFAWARIFHPFGPGEPQARIVPSLIRAHLRGSVLRCSQGTQRRDFIPAAALGEAIARLSASGVTGAVNLGSSHALSLREMSARIAGLVGREGEVRFGAFHDPGPESLLPVLDRLHHEVGWGTEVDLDAGLREAIAFWRSSGG